MMMAYWALRQAEGVAVDKVKIVPVRDNLA